MVPFDLPRLLLQRVGLRLHQDLASSAASLAPPRQ
jgi:hypothetical protein